MELQLVPNNDLDSSFVFSIGDYDGDQNSKYFVYNEKKYEFNFDKFIKVSRYFHKYQNVYKNISEINLLQVDEIDSIIPDSAIFNFISLCQCETCQIKNSDIFYIYYLSCKYEITQLTKKMIQHISIHKKELIFNYFLFKSHLIDQTTDLNDFIYIFLKDEIEVFAINLIEYIQNDTFLKLPIPVIYQILDKYYNLRQNQENLEDDQIIQTFLFKCLDVYKSDASLLFSFIQHSQSQQEIIEKLVENYSDVFDFTYLNPSLFECLTKLNSQFKKMNEKADLTISTEQSHEQNQLLNLSLQKESVIDIEPDLELLTKSYQKNKTVNLSLMKSSVCDIQPDLELLTRTS